MSSKELPVTDVMEGEQVLAKYALYMTMNDVQTMMAEVFTPDGTYSALGEQYTLDDFPTLVEVAPKGLFMIGTPEGPRRRRRPGHRHQPLCFVDQTNHDMRLGWYTDTYVRTEQRLAAGDAHDDIPAPQWRARLG